MPEVRPKKEGEDRFRFQAAGFKRLIKLAFLIPLLALAAIWTISNVGGWLTGTQGPEVTPAEQAAIEQAKYEEALLSSSWFLCGDYSADEPPCIVRGAHIVERTPLTFEFSYVDGVKERVATFIQDETCPGHWENRGETGEFCLEKQSDELYVGWFEDNSGLRSPFCLAYGRDSRHRKLEQKPIACVTYFTQVKQGERQLAEMGP